jgi:two-component system NtrC family sensor kinase
VLLRTSPGAVTGDSQRENQLVRAVLETRAPVAATILEPASELQKESAALAAKARTVFVSTPKARPRLETEETAGMMLAAAAPILDAQHRLLGVVYGGVLLNHNHEIVDEIKETVFKGVKYHGEDIGAATIFQNDVRICTNVRGDDSSRSVGTRAAEDVYAVVVGRGQPWSGRAYAVTGWLMTAIEPIYDLTHHVIGMIGVGVREAKYTEAGWRASAVFVGLAVVGGAASMGLFYFVYRNISASIRQLVTASREVAHGNLDARVDVRSGDEFHELGETFNLMAVALKKRDEKLKEFAKKRIMESERLAVIGQLAAGVAHELNNPMQGIVTYSHLLLEETPTGNPGRELAQKIVTQANRCTGIVRGLLDFSRQRKPQTRSINLNTILSDCVSLVKHQSLFHNIQMVTAFAPDLPAVVVDPTQMQQVFMNLIINAAEAMHGDGRLQLASRQNAGEQCVEVEVADTGHGISEENLERIFDPFFTTKEATHGTGLGLAISFGIIKEHQGTISVESEVGKGTTFTVRLPLMAEVPA